MRKTHLFGRRPFAGESRFHHSVFPALMKKALFLSVLSLLFTSVSQAATPVLPFNVSYASATNYPASTNGSSGADFANAIQFGNLRGDSTWRDLIIANKAQNTVTIRKWSNGAYPTATTHAVGLEPTAVRAVALNSDKYEDIVVANSGTNTVSVMLNNFGMMYLTTDFVVGTTPNPGPVAIATMDVDGNGLADIFTANSAEDSVSILLSSNSGFDFELWDTYPVGDNPQSIALADLDADGRRDILTADKTAGTLTILPRLLDGTFGTAQTVTLFPGGDPQPVRAETAKLNGDALVDIITANFASNTVSILTNTGLGTFVIATNIPVGAGPTGLLLRDLNYDGKLDIAVPCAGDNTVSILLQTNTNSFIADYSFAVADSPVAVIATHISGGLMDDLAVARNGNNTVAIMRYDAPYVSSQTTSAREDTSKSITIPLKIYPGRSTNITVITTVTNGTLLDNSLNPILNGGQITSPVVTYIPTADYYGADAFTFSVDDGVGDSQTGTNLINVLPVNDQPTFALADNAVTLTKFGAMNVISNIVATSDAGPANESAQKISYVVTTTNGSWFTVKPFINTNGTLQFQAASAASGSTFITVKAKDNGGVVNGGTNLSSADQIEIAIPSNPFPFIKGTYRGLFHEASEVNHDTSGYFQLTTDQTGGCSGKAMMKGKTFSFSGRFGVDGVFEKLVSRGTNGSPLDLDLAIDLVPNATDQITGTVMSDAWTAILKADRGTFHATTNIAPQAAKYTMIIPGGPDTTTSPYGEGFANVTVDAAGNVKMSGTLADGKAFGHTSVISKNGEWPLYVSPYTGKGTILSWITFTNENNTHFAGDLSWIKTGAAGGSPYPLGFTNEVTAVGSLFTPPGLIAVTNGLAILNGGTLATGLTNDVVLTVNGLFGYAWPSGVQVFSGTASNLVVSITTNGAVSGSFKHPVSGGITRFKGIVFQDQNTIGGFFLGTSLGVTQSGVLQIIAN